MNLFLSPGMQGVGQATCLLSKNFFSQAGSLRYIHSQAGSLRYIHSQADCLCESFSAHLISLSGIFSATFLQEGCLLYDRFSFFML